MNASRELVPLFAADASTFCKSLRRELTESGVDAPSHLTLLNMLARSAGFRNFQSLRAAPPAMPVAKPPKPATLAAAAGSTLPATVRKALGHFDGEGRLVRWPSQYAVQQLAMWALWSRLPGKKSMTEREVNEYLERQNLFGDPVTLRRELINAQLMTRTVDCRDYRKVAKQPDGVTGEFLKAYFAALG